jgi:hypothetical protein
MERTNFRYSKPEDFTEGVPDIATIDVSFISLRLILPPLHDILKKGGSVACNFLHNHLMGFWITHDSFFPNKLFASFELWLN